VRRKAMYPLVMILAFIAVSVIGKSVIHASNTDDRIESAAKESYVFKTYLRNDDIKVTSENGVVTLTGTVSDESHKSLAQETVANLPGVKNVDNKLEVKGNQPAEKSDAWLRARVSLALLFHRNVSAVKTDVDVKDGVVTLRGEASSEAQKELTTEYAKDVEGVKDVNNEMKVVTPGKKTPETVGEKIDDSSITAQVKLTLFLHKATSWLNTTVDTTDGVVTVSGKADNAAEKDLVTRLVSDIHGVKSVKNQMAVQSE
jgi:hyperosmotically inducible periplasmic protein